MPQINKNMTRTSYQDKMHNAVGAAFNDDYNFNVQSTNRIERDTAKLLGSSDENKFQEVPVDLIYPNKLNEPYMEGVTDEDINVLMYSIVEQRMLFHNLVVVSDGKGRYRLISGEKRWRAINRISEVERDEIFPRGIQCQIIPYSRDLSQIDEHIMLLTCNVIVASVGARDSKQVRALIRLYLEKGYENTEIMEYLSKYLQSSQSGLYKLMKEANAVDDLVELCDMGKITRSALQILGGLEKEDQAKIASRIRLDGLEVDESMASIYAKELKDAKKEGRKPQIASSSFVKANKALKSIEQSMEKQTKISVADMEQTETENILLLLDKIENHIQRLRGNITKAGQ